MSSSLSGIFAYSSSAAVAYLTVKIGYSTIYTQVTEPHIGGILRPISVAGAILLIFVGAILVMGILLDLAERGTSPQLLGRSTYTLVGSAGLLGSSIGVVHTIYNWSTEIWMEPTVGSIVSLMVVAAPVGYGFYCLWRPTDEFVGSQENKYQLDPEFVRDRTAQWTTNRSTQRQSRNRRRNRKARSNSKRATSQPDTQSNEKKDLDLTELKFGWTTETDVDFANVGGMGSVKRELERDVVKPLTTHREKAEALGITVPNLLFHGPPGTGKTYLAEALASELKLPFVKLSGADVQSKWINESSQKVRALFEESQTVAEQAGGAVIFLDELDSVLKNRGSAGNGSAHEEDTKVVNEFLSHLEETKDHNIVFIGATNRLESLDTAGIRSGRIDKKVHIGMPNHSVRASVLAVQLSDRPNDLTDEQIKRIADQTNGMSSADLASLVEDAARVSLFQRDDDTIHFEDICQVLGE